MEQQLLWVLSVVFFSMKLVLNPMSYENGKYAIDFAHFEQEIIEEKPDAYFMVNIKILQEDCLQKKSKQSILGNDVLSNRYF